MGPPPASPDSLVDLVEEQGGGLGLAWAPICSPWATLLEDRIVGFQKTSERSELARRAPSARRGWPRAASAGGRRLALLAAGSRRWSAQGRFMRARAPATGGAARQRGTRGEGSGRAGLTQTGYA